jgi:DNA-directed RNA polymerase specialized sigma24 family protein
VSQPFHRAAAAEGPPRWPARVIALAGARRSAEHGPDDAVLGELWTLVHLGLARYVRQHAARLGPVEPEDVRDIAAEKALDLMRKLDAGEWDPAASEPGQLCAFLSILARNGVVDHLRSAPLLRRPRAAHQATAPDEPRPHEAPSRALCRILFPRALLDCLTALAPRARKIWLLRAFYDLPSKTIARHPDVRVSPAAVDMTLARARIVLRRCMKQKGFDLRDLPAGTFAAVWDALARPREGA